MLIRSFVLRKATILLMYRVMYLYSISIYSPFSARYLLFALDNNRSLKNLLVIYISSCLKEISHKRIKNNAS
jgi:hypothetical protein